MGKLEMITERLGHFPTQKELKEMKKCNLKSAIDRYGGSNRFRELLGHELLYMHDGYWTVENTLKELKNIVDEINHFPTQEELVLMDKKMLAQMISINGGYDRFRILMGYEPLRCANGYWKSDSILEELKPIINTIKHFPKYEDLESMGRYDLVGAIYRNGGINKFRELSGYVLIRQPAGYWNDEKIIDELNIIINTIKHFPTGKELRQIDRSDLVFAIDNHGGVNKFRELLGHSSLKKPVHYWNDDTVLKELKPICDKAGCFLTINELRQIDRKDLEIAISRNGGMNKFRELLGYQVSMFEKYRTETVSYVNKRGKKTENLVKKIIEDYCLLHNLQPPSCNVKLTKLNVIEFVCETNKKIGIDVTNTKNKNVVCHKWRHKDYYKYLDELWIVVFSDVFKYHDYLKWNSKSPDNVKVFSIYQFLEELDYSLDENTKSKVDKYCKCTFHTKEELKDKS